MKRWLLVAAIAVLCVAGLLMLVLHPFAPLQTPEPSDALLSAAQGLDTIRIDAVFHPETQTLDVSQTLTLKNRTGTPLTELVLRTYAAAMRDEEYAPSATEELHSLCYPNGFSAGGIEIASPDLSYSYEDEAQTVLVVALEQAWQSGEMLTLTLQYTLTIPEAVYRFGLSDGVYALGNAFIIPAEVIDGYYFTAPYYSIGDPFLSVCRNYTVMLTLPQGYTAVGSGTAVTQGQTTTFTALASRDFALCISQSYREAIATQGNILIKAYAKAQTDADAMLAVAKGAMRVYAALYGDYPYPTFTLAEAGLPFDGMSYPSFAMIASDTLQLSDEVREIRIARELAKQWFQMVAASDNYQQPWQHEALAEYALLRYWEQVHGSAARQALQYSRVDTAMRLSVSGLSPGSPLDYFYSWSEYQTIVWYRGAAALCALELALDGKLDEFLAVYYDTYAFQIASRTDFERMLSVFSGEDWSPLLGDYLDTI
ncbi:MAG TPA: hypothetical protein PKU80_10030 [Candidatus Limiplasma sp.]|nr:hypothetical protein [Candidatus Limiplasma sp.]